MFECLMVVLFIAVAVVIFMKFGVVVGLFSFLGISLGVFFLWKSIKKDLEDNY